MKESGKFSTNIGGVQCDISASFRDVGGDLILLIHGLGCSKESFDSIWDRPEFESYTILAVDLPGHGQSDKQMNFPYRMQDHALVCAQIIDNFSYNRLHIVGHSMGGCVGLLLPDEILSSLESFASVEGNLIAEDCSHGSRKTISVSFEKFKQTLFMKFKVQFADYANLDSVSDFAFYESAKSLVEWSDSGQLLEKFLGLDCRVKYFFGDLNSRHPTVDRVGEVPKCEMPESGHFPMVDNPQFFYSELARFVNNVS